MTYPITPNPAIHVQPADIGSQQMLYTGGQLQTWAQNLPLAMTLQLVDAILSAFGATPAEIAEINADATTVYDGVEAWLTQANADTQALFASISASLQQSWLSFQNLLNGIVQETDADVAAAVAWLQGIGTAANAALTQIEDFLTTGDWSDLTTAVQDILQSIFGSSTSLGLVGSIPAPAVVNVTQNLQPVWDFPDAASLSGAGTAWSWDGTEDHTGVTGSGSAKVVANGVLQALRGTPGAVQASQTVTLTAYVMWSGLTYTGSDPIQLQVIPLSQSGSQLVAGTPVEVAQIASPASSGSWTELTGTYNVPSSGVAAVQQRLVVGGNASVGSVWWDDCLVELSGGFLSVMQDDVSALQSDAAAANAALSTLFSSWSTAITNDSGNWTALIADFQAAWNIYLTTISAIESSEWFTLQQLFDSLLGIDPSSGLMSANNVAGVGGDSNLVDTFTNWINQLGAALGGDVSDAGGLSWLAQLMNDLGVNTSSPLAGVVSTTQSNNQILAIVNNRPASAGLEATVESNGDYTAAAGLTNSVQSTSSYGTFITVTQAKTLGFVQWLGEYTAHPISGFYINFYKMDSSGNLDLLSSSTNLNAAISSAVEWYLWDLTTPISVNAGDVIAVEFQIIGSGGFQPYGYTAPIASSHPTAAIKQLGFTQNWGSSSASTISSGSIGWSQYAPYVGLGVGTPPPTPFFPQSNTYAVSSTHTIPSWANYIDLIAVGAGGGGEGETGAGNGDGGLGGAWATKTLVVGTDIAASGTITVTVGSGGSGGPYFTPGSAGTATTFSWTNPTLGSQTLTANGGVGGQPSTNVTSWGLSPGNQTFEGNTYFGGSTNAIGGVGNAPGGGGAGGAAFQYGFAGASGQAWTVDRQT